MTKKNPNRINVHEAIDLFMAYGLDAKIFNSYQLRVYDIETDETWDWYHTTGTLIRNSKKFGSMRSGSIKDPEEAAIFIRKRCDKDL